MELEESEESEDVLSIALKGAGSMAKVAGANMEKKHKDILSIALRGAGAVAKVAGMAGVPVVGMVGSALDMAGGMLKEEKVPEYVKRIEKNYEQLNNEMDKLRQANSEGLRDVQDSILDKFVDMKKEMMRVSKVAGDSANDNAKVVGSIAVMETAIQKLLDSTELNGAEVTDVKGKVSGCFEKVMLEVEKTRQTTEKLRVEVKKNYEQLNNKIDKLSQVNSDGLKDVQDSIMEKFVEIKEEIMRVSKVTGDSADDNVKVVGSIAVMEATIQKLLDSTGHNIAEVTDLKGKVSGCFEQIMSEVETTKQAAESVNAELKQITRNTDEIKEILAVGYAEMKTQFMKRKVELNTIASLAISAFEILKEMRYLEGIENIDSAHKVFFSSRQDTHILMTQFNNHRFELEKQYTHHMEPRRIIRFLNLLKDEGEDGPQKAMSMYNYVVTVEAKYLQLMSSCHIHAAHVESLADQFETFTAHHKELTVAMRPILKLDEMVPHHTMKITHFQKMVVTKNAAAVKKNIQFLDPELLNTMKGEDDVTVGLTSLFLAAKSGSLETVKMLTRANADPKEFPDTSVSHI